MLEAACACVVQVRFLGEAACDDKDPHPAVGSASGPFWWAHLILGSRRVKLLVPENFSARQFAHQR